MNPSDSSDVDGVQPAGAPAQVSRTNTFWVVPAVSVMPSVEASTNTAKRLSALITGMDSESADAETTLAIWAPAAGRAAAEDAT